MTDRTGGLPHPVKTVEFAVVGGGIAGLAAAGALRDAGRTVAVYDKGRGPGGRASTRRDDLGRFDHGAQYFTARSDAFRSLIARWERDGVAARWRGRFGTIGPGGFEPSGDRERWVGVPGMNKIVRVTAADLDVTFGCRIGSVTPEPTGWVLLGEDGALVCRTEAVVIAVPAPQAADLLADPAPELAATARAARMDPCWTVMAAFDGAIDTGFDGVRFERDGPLGWAGRDGSKPGRVADGVDRWVLQANPEWSRAWLERDAGDVGPALLAAFAAAVGHGDARVIGWRAHRWRYAAANGPVGRDCLSDAARGLFVCGDWLLGPRIEAAWLSGTAAGTAIVEAAGST